MALNHVVMDTCCLTDAGEYKSSASANSAVQITSIDGFFNRKRGRPPKNRFVEVYKSAQETPQAIFTSFKLERSDASATAHTCGLTAAEASLDMSTASASCFAPVNSSRVHETIIKTKKRIVPKISTTSIMKSATTTTTTAATKSTATATTTAAHIAATIATTAAATASLAATKQSKLIQKYQRMRQREESANTTTKTTATTTSTTAAKASASAAAAEATTTRLKATNTKEISCRKSTTSQINSIELKSDSKSFLDQWHKLRESSEQTHVQILIGNPHTICKEEKTSVRATGTFYPENSLHPSAASAELSELSTMFNANKKCKLNPKLRRECPMSPDMADGADEPEDLSSKRRGEHASAYSACQESMDTAEQATCLRLLQFKQLLTVYQQQLPGFMQSLLTQGYQAPAWNSDYSTAGLFPSVDLCALLENSAKQIALLAAANGPLDAHSGAAARKTPGHSIPIGYLKFRFNEDCGFPQCGYRKHQSHFHCNRNDCHYSFCDKTRFVQHTARHERLDSLMGDDFQQFRANVSCGHATCHFSAGTSYEAQAGTPALKKSSHFHCRKCDYVCADTNKVVAHRRLHGKMELIRSAGFCKVANNEHCPEAACLYAFKHTHYHCLICDYSVLSRTQLVAHKHRAAPAGPGPRRSSKVIAATSDN